MCVTKSAKCKAASNRGFSLLEVMIALLVLSIGMLGIAGLQAAAVRHNEDAKIRTQASFAMNSIINRMKAKIELEIRRDNKTRLEVVNAYATTTPATNCNPQLSDIANELACFKAEVDELFPEAAVSMVDNGDRTININVKWYNRDLSRDVNTDWTIRL